MKILQVTHRYPPQAGGIETHVREISERLVERGHEVTVCSADAYEEGQRREQRNGVKIRRFPAAAPSRAFYVAPAIAPAVRRAEADVVHSHNYHALPAFFAALGRTDSRLVHTAHYHGASADRIRNALLRVYRPVGKRTLQQADEVIAVSRWEHDRLRADLHVEATVIPNGVQLDRFDEAEPEARSRPYLLCVGRLEEYKRIQDAIQALAKLPEYDLLVAGSGEFRQELECVASRAGVADRVEFLGYVDDNRLPGLYAGADVCLQLSKFEAYGMTVAEALASGTPCVIRLGSALDDWVSNSGVVGVRSPTATTVVDAVEMVHESKVDRSGVLDWQEVVDRLEECYRRTVPTGSALTRS